MAFQNCRPIPDIVQLTNALPIYITAHSHNVRSQIQETRPIHGHVQLKEGTLEPP